MWTKRNRFAVSVRLFEDLYWEDLENPESHLHFSASEIDEIMPGDKAEPIDQKLVDKVAKYFKSKGEPYFQAFFTEYMTDWDKTLLPVRSALYAWIIEHELTGTDKAELVGKYIKLTQDLVAGGNTGLVHALLSKMTGTYHAKEDVPEENTDKPAE